jgi:hypothetical protein
MSSAGLVTSAHFGGEVAQTGGGRASRGPPAHGAGDSLEPASGIDPARKIRAEASAVSLADASGIAHRHRVPAVSACLAQHQRELGGVSLARGKAERQRLGQLGL